MSKKNSPSETDENREVVVVDDTEDKVVFEAEPESGEQQDAESRSDSEKQSGGEIEAVAETDAGDEVEVKDKAESETKSESEAKAGSQSRVRSDKKAGPEAVAPQASAPKLRRSWFSLFNFLLILGLAAAAGYYWWQQQQLQQGYRDTILELRQQIETRASNSRLDSSLTPLKADIGGLGRKIDELGIGQQSLRESSEKLYELYGRDKNDWQLAEVEYLMRVAQHK